MTDATLTKTIFINAAPSPSMTMPLPDLIVPFKKRVYRAVVDAFRELV